MAASASGSVTLHDYRNVKALNAEEQQELKDMMRKDQQDRQAAVQAAVKEQYKTFPDQPTATLPAGAKMPLIGLGTWKAERGQVKAAVEAAIRAGYRHIDCARIYGNEHEVGEALAAVLSEGVVQREDLFITSKLWNSEHAPERVRTACSATLSDLRLDYLDLYLIHWPVTGIPGPEVTPPLSATWSAMEDLVEAGLAKHVGVSNFSIKKLSALMQGARMPPAVNQVEAHPYWRNDELREWCASHGIHLTAYSPLGSPDSATVIGRDKNIKGPLQDAKVQAIAEQHGSNAGQVLIRWAVQRGTSALPKSTHPERIAANLAGTLSLQLSDEEMQVLSSLQPQRRMLAGTMWLHKAGPYRTLRDLWDDNEDDEGVIHSTA